MSEEKKYIAALVIDFLVSSVETGDIPEDNKDSVEFAVESIQDAFNVKKEEVSEIIKDKFSGKKLTDIVNFSGKKESSENKEDDKVSDDISDEDKAKADALKLEGNKAMTQSDFLGAIQKYSEAIESNPTNAVYFSNRAAAYSSARKHNLALKDAERAIKLDSKYAKAWSRLGLAKYVLGDAKGAMEAYEQGLKIEGANPSATMKKGYETAKKRVAEQNDTSSEQSNTSDARDSNSATGGNPLGGLSGLLNNPNVMQAAQQMMQNPEAMRGLMNNPQLRQMAQSMGLGGAGGNGAGATGGNGSSPSLQDLMNNPMLRNLASQFMGGQQGNQDSNDSSSGNNNNNNAGQ